MSVKATNFVRRLRGLSPTEKVVAFVMAGHDDHKGGGCYASNTTIAEEAGFAFRQTASDIVQQLKSYKVIHSAKQSEGGRPTVWHFNYDLASSDSPIRVAPLNRNPPTAANRSPRVAVDGTGTATEESANCNRESTSTAIQNGFFPPSTAVPELQEGFRSKGNTNSREAEGLASLATATTIRSAFRELGYEEPFGDAQFQLIWSEMWDKIPPGANAGGVDAMEKTIQSCQKLGIDIPPLFFRVKRKIETAELEHRFRRTPL